MMAKLIVQRKSTNILKYLFASLSSTRVLFSFKTFFVYNFHTCFPKSKVFTSNPEPFREFQVNLQHKRLSLLEKKTMSCFGFEKKLINRFTSNVALECFFPRKIFLRGQ